MASGSSSSSYMEKVKLSVEHELSVDDELILALDKAMKQKEEADERLKTIVDLLKEQMRKKAKTHSLRLEMEKTAGKLELADKILEGRIRDLQTARGNASDKCECIAAEIAEVRFPDIEYLKFRINNS